MTKLAPSPLPISSSTTRRTMSRVTLVVDVEAAVRQHGRQVGDAGQRLAERQRRLLVDPHHRQRRLVVGAGEPALGDLPVGDEHQHLVAGAVGGRPGGRRLRQGHVGEGGDGGDLADDDVQSAGPAALRPVQQREGRRVGGEDPVQQLGHGISLRSCSVVVTTAQRSAA